MADSVSISFSAQIGQLIDGVSQVKSSLDSVQESTDKISNGFRTLAEAAGISLSVEGIKTFVDDMANLGNRTESSMVRLGESAGQITTLSGVAKVAGLSFDSLQTDIERFSLNVQKAARDGFSPAAQGLKILGLSAKELTSLPAEEWILKLSDAVSKFNPSLNLTNAVMAAGGRGVAEMLPLLQQGRERFLALEAAVRDTGATLTNAQAGAFDQTHEKLTLLGLSVEGVGIKLFTILKPAIDKAADAIRNWLQSLKIEDIASGVTLAANFMIDLGAAVTKFFVGVKETIDEAKASINDFTVDIDAGTADVLRAFTTLAVGTKASESAFGAWGTAVHYGGEDAAQGVLLARAAAGRASAGIDQMAENAKVSFAKMTAEGVASAKAVGDAFAQSGKANAGPMNMGGAGALSAQLAQYQTMVKTADDGFALLKQQYEADVSAHRISITQETQDLLAALEFRHNAEDAAYGAALQAAQGDAAKYADVVKQKTAADEKFALEHEKIIDDAVKKEAQQWNSALEPIMGAWNSQLRGLLAGTETFGQAMKKVFGDLVIQFIENAEKMVVTWVDSEAAKTMATTVGAAARTSAEQAATATTLATQLAASLKSIIADAAKVFADVFAYFAPALGPFAAAPAAVASGAVLAARALLPSAEVGGYVVSPGLLMVHANETVVPAQIDQPYAGGAGGGGGMNVTFQVSAIDSNSVQAFFQQNAGRLSRILRGYQTTNPSTQ